jgi:transposase-like protein
MKTDKPPQQLVVSVLEFGGTFIPRADASGQYKRRQSLVLESGDRIVLQAAQWSIQPLLQRWRETALRGGEQLRRKKSPEVVTRQ